MHELTSNLPAWVPYATAGIGGAAVAVAVVWAGTRRRKPPYTARPTARTSLGDLAAAAIATAVSAEGMWETFGGMGMPPLLRAGTFAFIEIMVLQSARRARRSMAEHYGPGIDGVAMWVLTCLSAVLSASHEITADQPTPAIVMVRLVAPLIAAWGWERNMRLERRQRGLPSGINWRVTPERLLIRLGLAEPGERTAADVDAHRRLAAVARAAARARRLEETDAAQWRQRRAMARVDRLYEEADEYARLSDDTELQQQLLAQVGALYNTRSLVRLAARPWWASDDTAQEQPPDGGDGEPSATTVSLLARIRERRTDRRLGIRPARRTATRTEAPTGDAPHAPARTEPAPAVHTADPHRSDGPRTPVPARPHTTPGTPAQPTRTEQPAREPAQPAPRARRAEPARGAAVTPINGADKRAEWSARIADEIRAARVDGRPWEPGYDDLMARTGFRRRWCEARVQEARAAVARTDRTGRAEPARPREPHADGDDPERADRTGTDG